MNRQRQCIHLNIWYDYRNRFVTALCRQWTIYIFLPCLCIRLTIRYTQRLKSRYYLMHAWTTNCNLPWLCLYVYDLIQQCTTIYVYISEMICAYIFTLWNMQCTAIYNSEMIVPICSCFDICNAQQHI